MAKPPAGELILKVSGITTVDVFVAFSFGFGLLLLSVVVNFLSHKTAILVSIGAVAVLVVVIVGTLFECYEEIRIWMDVSLFEDCINKGEEYKIRGFDLKRKNDDLLIVKTPSGKSYKYQIVRRNYELGKGQETRITEHFDLSSMSKYTFYEINRLAVNSIRFARLGRDIYIDYKDTRVTLKRIRTKKE